MSTMKIRWLGTKRPKIVDLPIGLSAIGEKYGEVLCDPVGEFPIAEARKLLALPGAAALYMPEDEYQKTKKTPTAKTEPEEPPAVADPKKQAQKEATKEAQHERGRKLAALQAKKREEKQAAAGA